MIRYKKLGYVALNVSDVERSSRYYQDIVGLQQVKESKFKIHGVADMAKLAVAPSAPEGETEKKEQGPAFFRFNREHHQIALYPSKEPGLKRVGLELESDEQLEFAYERLIQAGVQPKEVDKDELKLLHQQRSYRFQEPNSGLWFEFYSNMTVLGDPLEKPITKIDQLGHVVLTVKTYEDTLKFLMETMNFKVSDYFGDNFAFMRCFPHPNHHTFAIGKGKENRLNHVNFMVSDIDDIGVAYNRLRNNDVTIVFGPGRHFPSDSIFLYFLDPDELTLEYSFGMEEFEEVGPRKTRYLELSRAIGDLWNGKRSPKMAAVGKIEGTD